MVRIDVCTLNRDKRFHIRRTRPESLSQKIRDNLDKFALQSGVPAELSGTACMADFNQLFIHEFHTSLAWHFEELDLGLYKKIESELRNEETWSRSGRVSDGSSDVKDREIVGGLDGFQRITED